MEEKKLDKNSVIGISLIGLILIWFLYQNQSSQKKIDAQNKAKKELLDAEKQNKASETRQKVEAVNYQNTLGAFAYSAEKTQGKESFILLENDLVRFKISTKGGQVVEACPKGVTNFQGSPLYLVRDGNSRFGLKFQTKDNRVVETQNMIFEPVLTDTKSVTLRAKVSENQYLEYRYALDPKGYMMDFTVASKGLAGILNGAAPIEMEWKQKGFRNSKSITYENRYTMARYLHQNGKVSELSATSYEQEVTEDTSWVAFRQHFFSSTLIFDSPKKQVAITTWNHVKDEGEKEAYTKTISVKTPLSLKDGELAETLHWYQGPADYKVLKTYEKYNLSETMSLGWGIFGWLNQYVFIPLFDWLCGIFPYGMAIIVMTILVKLLMSPATYKSYLSQEKMKVLRPEILEINEKYPGQENAMKRQQETMALYRKAGVSPLSGCIPSLVQLPIFYALFTFFPTAYVLRQKSFLWAIDLSSYDPIAQLPFRIPFYGDHVSLFPLLASLAIFFYMRMSTGQNVQPAQPGMPNMKFMIYLSPIMMLFFFNNYASGLSLYYFMSNLITIFVMLIIKYFIIDTEKIHAQIQENKKKPRKENRFQRKLGEVMKQAEEQKKKQPRK